MGDCELEMNMNEEEGGHTDRLTQRQTHMHTHTPINTKT